MNSVEYMRKKLARRAMFELQELTIDLLEENPEGLEPNQIAAKLGILIPPELPLYGTRRTDIAWGILNALVSEGRVKKDGSRAFLTNPSTEQSKAK